MNYILGGGISALIFNFYHKDYTIISPDVGGQFNSNFNLGPRYLHKNKYTEKFLQDIKLQYKERIVNVGYVNEFGELCIPDESYRRKYYMKSRHIDNLEKYDSSIMTSFKNSFEIYDIDFKLLIDKLSNIKYINGNVKSINLHDKKLLVNNKELNYNKIVSTIPLNIFNKMTSFTDEIFQKQDMIYIKSNEYDINISDYDYVYDIRKDKPWHRVSKDKGFIYDLCSYSFDFPFDVLALKELNGSQIISTTNNYEPEDVLFLGRYGEWKHNIKIEDVIQKSMETNF